MGNYGKLSFLMQKKKTNFALFLGEKKETNFSLYKKTEPKKTPVVITSIGFFNGRNSWIKKFNKNCHVV